MDAAGADAPPRFPDSGLVGVLRLVGLAVPAIDACFDHGRLHRRASDRPDRRSGHAARSGWSERSPSTSRCWCTSSTPASSWTRRTASATWSAPASPSRAGQHHPADRDLVLHVQLDVLHHRHLPAGGVDVGGRSVRVRDDRHHATGRHPVRIEFAEPCDDGGAVRRCDGRHGRRRPPAASRPMTPVVSALPPKLALPAGRDDGRGGAAAHRDGLPVQPVHPRRRAGAGDGARPRAARDGHRGARARAVRRAAAGHVRHAARQQPADRRPTVRSRRSRRTLSCQLRTIRALTDEEFDVLHLHEPFIPGPTQTALLLHTAPIIATFHSAGESAATSTCAGRSGGPADRLDAPGRRLEGRAGAGPPLHRRRVRDPLQRCRARPYRERRRAADGHGPTIFFCGRHEERKGLDVLLARDAAAARRRHAVGRGHRARHRAAARGVRARPTHRVARPADRRRQDRPPQGRRRVLRAVAARRVVRRRADRGDGRRHGRSSPAASTAIATSPPTASTPCWSSRATSTQLATALARGALSTRDLRAPRSPRRGQRRPTTSRCARSPRTYVDALPAARRRSSERRRLLERAHRGDSRRRMLATRRRPRHSSGGPKEEHRSGSSSASSSSSSSSASSSTTA